MINNALFFQFPSSLDTLFLKVTKKSDVTDESATINSTSSNLIKKVLNELNSSPYEYSKFPVDSFFKEL